MARPGICTMEVLLLSISVLILTGCSIFGVCDSSRRPNIDFPISVSRLPWRWGMGAGCFIVSPFSVYMRCFGFQAAGQVHFSSIVESWSSNSANDFIRRASGFSHRFSVCGPGRGDRRYGEVLGDGRRGGHGHALLHTHNAEGQNYDFPI